MPFGAGASAGRAGTGAYAASGIQDESGTEAWAGWRTAETLTAPARGETDGGGPADAGTRG